MAPGRRFCRHVLPSCSHRSSLYAQREVRGLEGLRFDTSSLLRYGRPRFQRLRSRRPAGPAAGRPDAPAPTGTAERT
eukprot:scaffold82505_cov64-Phaeocystis_antarctica.AAC.4